MIPRTPAPETHMSSHHAALIVALIANAFANILIKHGMRTQQIDLSNPGQALLTIATNVPVLIGVTLFAVNVLAYSYVLTKIPLSTAYPIMTSVGFLIVISASLFMLGERMSSGQFAGVALIIAGVVLVAKGL